MSDLKDVALFDITDAAISELKTRYISLSIKDIEDKEGYANVRAARIDMKGYRVSVDKRRKELNEEALKHQRRINAEAKKITDQLTPIEDYLAKQEQEYNDKIEQIKREKEALIAAKRQERINKMLSIGFSFNGVSFVSQWSTEQHMCEAIQFMPDETFAAFFVLAEKEYLVYQEEKRLAQIAADELAAKQKAEHEEYQRILAEERARVAKEQEAENKRLAEQRAEQQERERVIAEKEEALKAEAEKIEAAKRAEEIKNLVVAQEKVFQETSSDLKYFEVIIGGKFKARHTLQAKSVEQAREQTLTILHNLETDLYLEFDQTDIDATDVS